MADKLFLFMMLSMIFSQAAGFAKKRWEKIIGFSGAIIFTVLSIVAFFAERK